MTFQSSLQHPEATRKRLLGILEPYAQSEAIANHLISIPQNKGACSAQSNDMF